MQGTCQGLPRTCIVFSLYAQNRRRRQGRNCCTSLACLIVSPLHLPRSPTVGEGHFLEFPSSYPSPLLGDSVSIYLAKSPRAQAICLDRPASISRKHLFSFAISVFTNASCFGVLGVFSFQIANCLYNSWRFLEIESFVFISCSFLRVLCKLLKRLHRGLALLIIKGLVTKGPYKSFVYSNCAYYLCIVYGLPMDYVSRITWGVKRNAHRSIRAPKKNLDFCGVGPYNHKYEKNKRRKVCGAKSP